MVTVTLVENKIDDGWRLLDRLNSEGIVVLAACWIKPVEEDRWTLYIATPTVDAKGSLEAYRQLIPILQSLGDDWITSSDVTMVGEKHPIVQYALDILRRFPHKTPIRPPRSLKGISVEEVYVYPLGITPVTIYGLVYPGAPGDYGHLSLERHNANSTLNVDGKNYSAKTGIDWKVAAPFGATVEKDKIGRMVLVWDRHGQRIESTPNQVLAFAELGLHGFRILSKPA